MRKLGVGGTRFRWPGGGLIVLLAAAVAPGACGTKAAGINDGHPGGTGSSSGSGGSGDASANGDSGVSPGGVTASNTPFDPKTAADAARKVKNLLVGLAPTDADVAALTTNGAAGLQQLIISWTTDATTQPFFQQKMIGFFRNAFQQTGFTPTVDFMPQLLENGGFDFGPFGVAAVGDDAFARLVQNLQDEFAMTAWQIVSEGQPFNTVLTTQRYMMTTGLKSVYLQIEMPNDQPYSFGAGSKLAWKIDYSGNPIDLTDSLNPSSPNYMVFSDEPPATMGSFFGGGTQFPTCRGGTVKDANGNTVTTAAFGGAQSTSAPTGGYAQLFQRLLGYTPRWPFLATPTCWEHPSKPYFTDQDMSDWQWVTVTAKGSAAYIQPYDLPTLRATTTLPLALPRIGFYTTPAYLAIWNTNNSNQHRVTANQTLLAALGESFTSEDSIVPISESGLDSDHSVAGSDCLGCHKELDPMRTFWANQFDFNDRNDWITSSFTGAPPNPRPTSTGGVFAFADVNMAGASMLDYGALLGQVTDQDPTTPLNQFAAGITQKLCFYANSQACDPTDPVFRGIAFDFVTSNYNFPALIKELFSSTIVTGVPSAPDAGPPAADDAGDDAGVPPGEAPISIARRDHFCAALSNRLGVTDICALAVPIASQSQSATQTVAGSVPADGFSRGAQSPVTASEPTRVLPRGGRGAVREPRAAARRHGEHGDLRPEQRRRRHREHGAAGDGLSAERSALHAGRADPHDAPAERADGQGGHRDDRARVDVRPRVRVARRPSGSDFEGGWSCKSHDARRSSRPSSARAASACAPWRRACPSGTCSTPARPRPSRWPARSRPPRTRST